MKIYNYPSKSADKKVEAIVNRGLNFNKKDVRDVTRILEDVRKNGDKALVKYANRFDSPGLTAKSLKVTHDEMVALHMAEQHLAEENAKPAGKIVPSPLEAA